MVRFTLSKKERLSSLKAIAALFEQGQSLAKYPVRLVWMESSEPEQMEFPIQVMFSVSKKKFPRAVDRNRIRRLMREGYRHLKPALYVSLPPEKLFYLALIYTGSEVLDGSSIQKGIDQALDRWLKNISVVSPPVTNGGNHQV